MHARFDNIIYYLLTGLFGLIAGAMLAISLPQPGSAAGVDATALAGLPAISVTNNSEFAPTEIRAKAGETVALQLHNTDGPLHSLDIDELNVHAPMPLGQTSLALFKATNPGRYTFYCKAHFDRASGRGMHGTLVVEPLGSS